MSWFSAVVPLLVAVALLVVPGYITARVLTLRGLWAWALAAPASMSVIVLASLWANVVGVRWSVLPVLITAVAVVVIAVVVRVLARPAQAPRSASPVRRAELIALGSAAVLLAAQLVLIIGDPQNISQTFDNVFHLNAVRYIMDTGAASPLTVGSMTSDGGLWFYPDGWHALVALVVDASGASIMVASNAVLIAVAVVAWPATVLLLTRVIAGSRPVALVTAGVLSAILPTFPILMIDYGVLYPYFLALSLLPAVLAVTVQLLRFGSGDAEMPAAILTVALLGSLPGLVISHPGAFVAWIVLAVIACVLSFIRLVSTKPSRSVLVKYSVLLFVVLAAAAAAWKVLKPPADARGWAVEQSVGQAVGQALTLSQSYGNVAWVAVILLCIGLGVLVRRRTLTALMPVLFYAAFATLYIVSSAMVWPQLRDLLTASWYNNSPRLAAVLPMLLIPIAAVGGAALFEHARRLATRESVTRRGAIVIAIVGVVVIGAQAYTNQQAVRYAAANYAYGDEARLISHDERALLDRLPSEVPEDAVIVGSAWTGAGLAYAFADRQVIMPHMLMDLSEDDQLILDDLSRAEPGSPVCDALERTGTEYVLDFGTLEVHGAEHKYPGIARLGSSDAVRLVDSEGQAKLYEVTGCE
ncbi:hypothetical protein FVO59_11245 [Microbacterium esteraromaticum]|uniref:Uncharacterized protein n=1 Tax=Microbacterium esteraromaticum TaxID=57043 RepID=A0A7D8AHJ3_9MICO|nr:DUF6541 family protein [Microbacterium esteraromaticum]QMU97722.1 hypothetical protein FVO59_11245 [Microbacterium esteraromaticum]